MVKYEQPEIEGRPRSKLRRIAGKISDEFAFSHIHGMAVSALERGYSIDVALEQMRLLKEVCILYPLERQGEILRLIERQYMAALTRTDSRLYQNVSSGRDDSILIFHRNVSHHHEQHGINLTNTGLVRAMEECFYDLGEPNKIPRFTSPGRSWKDLKQPEPAFSGQYGGPRGRK